MVLMSKTILPIPMRSTTEKHRLFLLLFAFIAFFASGCSKDASLDLNPSLNTANNIVIAHRAFIHVFDMMLKASVDSALHASHHATIDLAIVTYDPAIRLYSFQYSGTLCPDSVIRYGSFVIRLDTGFFVAGARASVEFISYFEDGYQIKSHDSIVNTGTTPAGKISFSSIIDSTLIVKDSVHMIRWKANLNHFVDPSFMWQGPPDAVVLVEGSGSGISSMGYSFSSMITKPVNDYLNCPWLRDGIIGFAAAETDAGTGTIHYAAGTSCNDSVSYDFDGTRYFWRMDHEHLAK
jgi:hypothetical protein